jgi:hypothetical protein
VDSDCAAEPKQCNGPYTNSLAKSPDIPSYRQYASSIEGKVRHVIDSAPSLRAAASLSSRALANYLGSKGWAARPSKIQGISIFSKRLRGASEPVEFILPVGAGLPDEDRRVADALRTLEAVESRPIIAIVDDIDRLVGKAGAKRSRARPTRKRA